MQSSPPNAPGQALALDMRPHHHLRPLDGDGRWESVGNDPCFLCEGVAMPLPKGWYRLDIELENLGGPPMWPYWYPSYGGGRQPEPDKVFVPLCDPDARTHREVVLFTHDVLALRFDPAVTVGRFRLGEVRLTRIGKLEAARHMLGRLVRRPASMARKLSWLAALGRDALAAGAPGFASRLNAIYAQRPESAAEIGYQTWLELYDPATPEARQASLAAAAALRDRPLFSIILPVYDTAEQWLRRCVQSVQRQSYDNWELCIADDASPGPQVRRVLAELAAADARIKVVHRPRNGHISACSNSAIELATGPWLVLLDHDDELHPDALLEAARALERNPRWKLVYSDEDKIDEKGRRFDPYMKPDWNYDLFLSHNCVSHLGIYDAALVRDVGGFREGMEGSQDWDLALRCIERLAPDQIGHIPKVLYHWRAIAGSTALAPQEKNYAHLAGARAIGEHLERTGSSGRVEDIPGQRGNYRVRYAIPDPAPLVSIIIPSRDKVELLRACIESVTARTRYPNYEILIVDNQSVEQKSLDYLASLRDEPRVRVLPYDAPFNYSEINNHAAAAARGEVLCLLNNDITVISEDWLDEMVGHALRPGVGAVGAMLYYPNDTIQHAGVVVGAHGVAAHAYSGYGRGHPGHMSRARLTQSLSAVTAACLVVTHAAFDAVDGLDPLLQVAFNDVDFCLRLQARGYRNIWTPFAELYHHESASRGYEDSREKMERFNAEMILMRERWSEVINHDPAYSLNHSTDDELCQLAFPPRVSRLASSAAGPA